jgi:hypothetical protein
MHRFAGRAATIAADVHALSYRESTCFHCPFILEDQAFLASLSICRRGHCFRPSPTTPLGVGRRSIELRQRPSLPLSFVAPASIYNLCPLALGLRRHLDPRCPCSSTLILILI